MMDSIPLSEALPEETDRQDLTAGIEFAITGIVLEDRSKKMKDNTVKTWKTAKLNGVALPDFDPFVKYKTSASAIVRKCEGLRVRACFDNGACKKAVRVRVVSKDGNSGSYLDLEDA